MAEHDGFFTTITAFSTIISVGAIKCIKGYDIFYVAHVSIVLYGINFHPSFDMLQFKISFILLTTRPIVRFNRSNTNEC